MLWWPESFCARLAGRGRYVIRYDQRETGLTTYAPAGSSYTLADLAEDMTRVLDGYAIPATHIVGMSLGGMAAQIAALEQPSRVLSLTAISSSPVGIDTSHLPGFSDAYTAHMAEADSVDWSDREQVIA